MSNKHRLCLLATVVIGLSVSVPWFLSAGQSTKTTSFYANLPAKRKADRDASNYFLSDLNAKNDVAVLIHDIYEYSGHQITSWPQLVRTDFYPFKQPLSTTCHGGSIKLQVQDSKAPKPITQLHIVLDLSNADTWSGYYKHVPKTDREDVQEFSAQPGSITRRILRSYVEGVSHRSKHIEEIRTDFLRGHQYAMKVAMKFGRCSQSNCPLQALTIKPVRPRPLIDGDFPMNQSELQVYVQWLRATEGADRLKDGWGRDLEFSLRDGRITCHSYGADGTRGTKDDIVMTAPTRPTR